MYMQNVQNIANTNQRCGETNQKWSMRICGGHQDELKTVLQTGEILTNEEDILNEIKNETGENVENGMFKKSTHH